MDPLPAQAHKCTRVHTHTHTNTHTLVCARAAATQWYILHAIRSPHAEKVLVKVMEGHMKHTPEMDASILTE